MDRYIERERKDPICKRTVRDIGLAEIRGMKGVIIGTPIHLKNGAYELPLLVACPSQAERDCGSITVDKTGRIIRNIRISA